jgi:feruloyl esterase
MNQTKTYFPGALSLVAIGALSACGGGDGDVATPPVQMACASVSTAAVNLSGLTVASAVSNAASGAAGSASSYPAHCQVKGAVNQRTGVDGKSYAIGYDIRLPATGWNGKFFYAGDSGLDGAISDPLGTSALGGKTNALSLGYAVASSDGGHIDGAGGLDGSFGLDPQARADYGYNALGTLTPLAKKIVTQFYGVAPSRAYYTGCSKGGQSGLMAASRFADQFDGIIAGNPGMDLPKATIAQIYDTQQFATVNANIANAFAAKDLALVASQILAKCDALDGAADGIVNDQTGCKTAFNFSTDVPQCATGVTPDGTCLSAVQKTALAAVYAGPKTSAGDGLYADWAWDPGLVGGGWAFWKTFLNPNLGAIAMGNVWATPPVAPIAPLSAAATSYWQNFKMDTAYNAIYGTNATFPQSAMDFMGMPDPLNLPALKAKGKLLVYHGTADPVFSSNHTASWYSRLQAKDAAAASYARLFLIPGMTHCGGGPATDSFDAFTPLVEWVEKGSAPDTILATVGAGNADKPAAWSSTRSRPLCAYPKHAVLKSGATDLESAASFVCQ